LAFATVFSVASIMGRCLMRLLYSLRRPVTISGETHDYAGRFFYTRCGSPVFARSDDEIEIHLGSLDAADHLIPTYESWTVHRAAWLPAFGHTTSYTRDRKTTGRSET
jgi:hypothetical protein